MNEKIIGSAPGKIILFGEHFVVKGVPALAMAINLRAEAKITFSENNCTIITSRELGKYQRCNKKIYIEKTGTHLQPFLKIINDTINKYKNLTIDISSKIPIGAGLGSSGATSTAIAGGIYYINRKKLDKEAIYELSMKAEKIFHSKPSGIDPRTSLEGGFILFTHSKKHRRLTYNIPSEIRFLIIDSGIPRQTSTAVNMVLKRYEKYRKIMEKIYDSARLLIDEALVSLKNRDFNRLGELMLINHGLLNTLGVSFPTAEKIIKIAMDNGALGAKITGAGMGGFILVLIEKEKKEKLIKKIVEHGFTNIIEIGYEEKGLEVRNML